MEDLLSNIEEDVLALVGQIEYGDISDLPTYWKSLLDSLLKLDMFRGVPAIEVSEVLNKVPANLKDTSLVRLTEQMEEISAISSTDTIEDEDLSDLRDMAVDFEKRFMHLLEGIQENASSE
ncbi:hypothetical protein [Geomonas anaerohicana]|uniref:Uncharacterized protein n=1 Tax=Geomonas anaerohicana TaxID=2798583 RepID=A0ABS0YK49_9BACT|nr:hypothetical protein [Geomonas anaerohicana]MBJ6752680.1 hypothetical protein [Geomonas anaerohicana]